MIYLIVYGTLITSLVSCFDLFEVDSNPMKPYRVLILAANPQNTDRLRLDQEVREIQTALEASRTTDKFEIVPRWAVRVDDLQKALLDTAPQIVHFSGHGGGEQGLVLEDEQGKLQMVSTKALATLFSLFQNTIQCVCLNACYSEIQAEAIHQSIDCVVGMNQPINDKAAIKFAQGFYQAIAANRSFESAYGFGCNAIDLHNNRDGSVPVLKYRPRSTALGEPSPASAPALPNSAPPIASHQQNRNVSIGGSVTGSVIQTGDGNTASVQVQPAALPQPQTVDMVSVLEALQTILTQLESPDSRKIANAVDDANAELKKPQPDKDEVGQALDRALNYAKKANGFAEAIDKLRPQVEKAAAWLGENWYKLLALVGLKF
jgi:CHAT domain